MSRGRAFLLSVIAGTTALMLWQSTGDRAFAEARHLVHAIRLETGARETPMPPPLLLDALVASEDPEFLARAAWRSPLSNYMARIRVSEMRGQDRQSMLGFHLRTVFVAIGLDLAWSHDEILRAFLGWVYFGRGCYGAAAASEGYFATPLGAATDAQLLALATFPRSPTMLPSDPERRAARRALVIRRMEEAGVIDRAEARRLAALAPAEVPAQAGCP